MHGKLHAVYNAPCCTPQYTTLAFGDASLKKIKAAFEKATKYLHGKGGFKVKDLLHEDLKPLIDETFNVLHDAVNTNLKYEVPKAMLNKLRNDVFVFSGMKTYAQLKEASTLLTTENGDVKPWHQFQQEVLKIHDTYNVNYLQAEHQYAIGTAQSVDKYMSFAEDGDRYNLQIRTAQDDKVRPVHAALHNLTLPFTDPFWDTNWTPFDWRCRCNILQVLKSKYEITDRAIATSLGEKAVPEMFRFNPGKQAVIFPPKHPYYKLSKEAKNVIEKEFDKNGDEEISFKKVIGNLSEYEDKLGIKINKSVFGYLNEDVKFTTETKLGAHYHENRKTVAIPIDKRRKLSKWNAEAVVYHEFGHAADHQNNFYKKQEVLDLMKKHRVVLSKENGYREIDRKLKEKIRAVKEYDDFEKLGAASDTLMSLNTNYGSGHSKKYFEVSGNKEKEFIAHAFENRFKGNDIFEEIMPELYKDMKDLIDKIKPQ